MPQIIVVADRAQRPGSPVMFTERVSVQDFESQHFQGQLVERLGWAVGDADAVERNRDTDEYTTADTTEDWTDEPRDARRETSAPPDRTPGSPERPRRGRLTAVGPMS